MLEVMQGGCIYAVHRFDAGMDEWTDGCALFAFTTYRRDERVTDECVSFVIQKTGIFVYSICLSLLFFYSCLVNHGKQLETKALL